MKYNANTVDEYIAQLPEERIAAFNKLRKSILDNLPKGFLLNHLIHELLPDKGDGLRWSNSDPITGQAAWYDLRVKIEKAPAEDGVSQPETPAQNSPVGQGPKDIAYGEEF